MLFVCLLKGKTNATDTEKVLIRHFGSCEIISHSQRKILHHNINTSVAPAGKHADDIVAQPDRQLFKIGRRPCWLVRGSREPLLWSYSYSCRSAPSFKDKNADFYFILKGHFPTLLRLDDSSARVNRRTSWRRAPLDAFTGLFDARMREDALTN